MRGFASQAGRMACVVALLGGALALLGCRRDRPTVESATPLSGSVAAPVVARGLGVEVWAIEDRGGELASALHAYAPPPEIEASVVEQWRASGLRLVAVPIEALGPLRSGLRFVAPIREESLVEAVRWRPVARGPRLNGERVVTAFGPAPTDDGWPRMLVRGWAAPRVVPDRPSASAMRLELVPQIVQARGSETIERIEARLRGQAKGPGEDGPVLRELALSGVFESGHALLVVGEDPETVWGPRVETPGEEAGGEGAPVGPVAPEEIGGDGSVGMGVIGSSRAETRVAHTGLLPTQPAGPGAPEYRTLGEAMRVGRVGVFAEQIDGASVLRAGRRAVLVITPRVAGPYSILAPAPGVGGS
ncbi:MAG: hypothetical protein ACIARR_02115 [Phycisphaerales bacterium JB059]